MPGVMNRNGDIQYHYPDTNGHDYGRRDDRRMSREHYPDDLYTKVHKQNGGPPPQDYRRNYHENPAYIPDHHSVASRDGKDGPVFDMDHLATFKVSQRQGLMYPEDGMNRLRQMETSAGVWTMRCQMIIDRKSISVIDKQTGDEMESFPLHLISEPTPYMNRDRKDLYNNVVLFTVLDDPKKHHSGPSEMHIFQSISAPAIEIVEEIKHAKSNGKPSQRSYAHPRDEYSSHIPPPPTIPAPEPPGSRPHVREAVSRLEQMQIDRGDFEDRPLSRFRNAYGRGPDDDQESVVSERTDREVQLLNHCFDDIERFVARLQQAADSFKELEDRRHKGKSKKKKGHGEGMLTMRARPPPPQDFIDVFQKFKLSFNLLARLKAHIHNPNAPELVHFLFTPLSLIIEASKDPRHGTPDLAAKVVAPLLTRDAKELLLHCLSSKEADLWMSLGDAWTVSGDVWKGYVPPYIPRFEDGWTPPPGLIDDGTGAALANAVAHHAAQIRNKEENYRAREEAEERVYPVERSARPPYNETVYRDNQRRENNRDPRDYNDFPPQLHHQDARSAGFQAYVEKHIDRNQRAHEDRREMDREPVREREREPLPIPSQGGFEDEQRKFARELKANGSKIYEVLHEREGKNEKELTVTKGEIIEVLDSSRNWWKLRNSQGKVGHAPYTIIQEIKDDHPLLSGYHSGGDRLDGRDNYRDRDSGAYTNFIPPPPPPAPGPPPPPQQQRGRQKKAEDDESKASRAAEARAKPQTNAIDDVNSELKQRWSRIQSGRPKSAAQVYITSHSSPADVKEWLYSKGFNERAQHAFGSYTGRDMFELSRHQAENFIGHEEGSRLDSQLTVQKNICGYSSTQGRNSELKAILQRRKERADSSTDENDNSRHLGRPPSYAPDTPPESDVSSDYENVEGDMTLRAQLRRQKKQMNKKY